MEQDINTRWKFLEKKLESHFDKKMTMESILFLIGVRELGSRPRPFSKEEKVDLMHIAICKLLSLSGYYRLSHLDQDGWPHWELVKALPHTDMFSQVHLLREHMLMYFETEEIFS
ncbi:MAG: hypothetical protein SF052_21735 [Bacteroidia bacterium]|nr:hypothetical protein [Bacteroidia bacterium]